MCIIIYLNKTGLSKLYEFSCLISFQGWIVSEMNCDNWSGELVLVSGFILLIRAKKLPEFNFTLKLDLKFTSI